MGRRPLAAIAAVVALSLTSACSGTGVESFGAPSGGRTDSTAVTTGAALVDAAAWHGPRRDAAEALVRARVDAITAGDEAAWLKGVTDPALRAHQARIFEAMRAMGVANVVLTSIEETVSPAAVPADLPTSWTTRARLEYRLRGFDDSSRSFALDLTFQAAPARPAGAAVMRSRPADRPQPWDLPGLVVRRRPGALVLAAGGPAVADELVRRATKAARRVSDVLGSAAPAVWVAPATPAEAARLLGREDADLDGVAAVIDGPIGGGRPAGADRIIVVPTAWSALTGEGREVVMAHELTHATTRRSSVRQPPLWLSEGLAEFVAYRDVRLDEADLVRSTIRRLRTSGLPSSPPDSADFEGSAEERAVAYGLSLLLARTIAERHGSAGLLRLFGAVNEDGTVPPTVAGDPEVLTSHYLRTLLGTDLAEVVAAWRHRLSRLSEGND